MKNSTTLVCNISSVKDLQKLDNFTKYINIDVIHSGNDVFTYLIDNGQKYLYSELVDDIKGFFYVDYDTFIKGEVQVKNIIEGIDDNFSDLEKLRYIYITLGKYLMYDINSITQKNDHYQFNEVGNITNMWSALAGAKVNSLSTAKILRYLCHLLNISCKILFSNKMFYNEITIGDQNLKINLFLDIPYIQFGFPTIHFSMYNDDLQLDKKIGYISKKYNSVLLDKSLKKLMQSGEFAIENILSVINKVIDVHAVGTMELKQMLTMIFYKYYSDMDITFAILYVNGKNNSRSPFVLISVNDKYYCYNYTLKNFIAMEKKELMLGLNNGEIGIYIGETIPHINLSKLAI